MKKLTIIITVLLLFLGTSSSQAQAWSTIGESQKGELNVFYYENEPYAYTAKNGKLAGIEVDILNEFIDWAKEKKGVDIKLKYTKFDDFNHFSQELAGAPSNTIGLGSVAITPEREKVMKFSAPYLKNVSVLVSDGSVSTARSKEELMNLISELKPVTIKGSIHEQYLTDLYKEGKTKVKFSYEKEENKIPLKIKESAKYFAYIDLISFWMYVKSNEDHFIKMHQFANIDDERFGFAFSSQSDWDLIFNEFFESGFGFTATKKYHAVLEKYLGYEIIDKVEIN